VDLTGLLAVTFLFGGGTLFLLAISPVGRAIAARIQGKAVTSDEVVRGWRPPTRRRWTTSRNCAKMSRRSTSGWILPSGSSPNNGRERCRRTGPRPAGRWRKGAPMPIFQRGHGAPGSARLIGATNLM
jgi:hypothetical protein